MELGEDERATDPLIADYWSPATMRILSSMPSRTIGESSRDRKEANDGRDPAMLKSRIFSTVRSQQGSHHLSVLQQNHAVTQTQAEPTLHQTPGAFCPTQHPRLRPRRGHAGRRG